MSIETTIAICSKPTSIQVTWYPILDDTASQLLAEGDEPFTVTVNYGPDDTEQVPSLHDGLMHFVSVEVPATAKVEVEEGGAGCCSPQ